jgi:Flp pilus assembly protein TadB
MKLSSWKTIVMVILVSLGGFLLFMLLKWSWWLSLIIAIVIIIFGLGYDFLHQASQKAINQQNLTRILMDTFAMIKVLIMQGMSPYQSLQTVLPYVPQILAEKIHLLTIDIDQDASIQPYLTFSQSFHSLMIEQLLFAFYQLETQGGGPESLQQFQYLFDQADQHHMQSIVQRLHDRMQSANGQTMIATGLIAFSLLIGVMQLIARVIYGL